MKQSEDERQEYLKKFRDRSGNVVINDKLTSFLYELMRDYLTPGQVESILLNSTNDVDVVYTNGWLAEYANDIAKRLK